VGSDISIQGTISATTIAFATTDVAILGPTTLTGNISMVGSVIGVHSPLVIRGYLLLRSSLQAPMPQSIQVTMGVVSGDTAFIYDNIRLFTPTYTQNAGTLHLSGIITSNVLTVAKGAILSTKLITVIHSDIRVQGGLLEFHNSTNITGSLQLDSLSQTILYNTGKGEYPVVHVDGSLHLDGSLVYWITPAPQLGVAASFKVFTYSSDLSGKFATHDSYAPNIKLLKFDLIYGDKEITLKYMPSKPLGVGAVVGIVLGSVTFILLIVVGLFLYRRYQKRQEYTSIDRIEEEINKYLITNTPQQNDSQ